MTLSIMTFSIKTVSIHGLFAKTQHIEDSEYAAFSIYSIKTLCHYSECQVLLNFSSKCGYMLSVIMLNVVMPNAIMLSVVAHN